ncbi:MAG TPA: MFS transporter [Jatrophihabitans sp.]|nr:MFS transporter [Jatrophihabitans sp.]
MRRERNRVLAVMCAGMFVVLLDVTIVNVALPRIAAGLRLGVATLQWVVDGYAVAIASLLLAGGTLGDRYGHRRVLLAGFALFGLASVACASAPTGAVLVAARAAQGVGGALLLPSTMAVIADEFPQRGEQARALGTWAAVSSLALPAGPLLGGLLVGTLGWRWVFWVNVPLVLLAVAGTLSVVPRRAGRATARLDVAGLAGLVIGLAALVFAVIAAGRGAGAAEVGGAAAVALLGFAVGLRAERLAEYPVLPLDLLRRTAFVGPNVVALIMNLTFNGLLFVVTLYLQDVRGFPPIESGLVVLPMAVPLVALAPVSGRLTAARGPRTAVLTGCVIAAVGALPLLGVRPDGGLPWLLLGLGGLGCGAGLVTASAVAAVVAATPADRRGLATGTSNTARQTGTASGVAVFGAIAGTAGHASSFVHALHVLTVVAAALWCAAALLAGSTIATRSRAVAQVDRPGSGTGPLRRRRRSSTRRVPST